MSSNKRIIKYNPSATGLKFHESRAQVRAVGGPIGCLSPETEIMTPDGWVRIDQWVGQDILQWDSDLGATNFAKPNKYISGPESQLYRFINGSIDMVLSGEHRIPFYDEEHEFHVWTVNKLLQEWSETITENAKIGIPISAGPIGVVAIMMEKHTTLVEKVKSSDGKMYCFETDTGFFVARHNDSIFITGNSGKTVMCCMQVWFEMGLMPANSQGIRSSAWCFIRDTEVNLRDTTMVTWLKWFPEDIISFVTRSSGNMKIDIRADLEDGTKIESIIHCKHQSTLADIENLKSLELTGVYINEANKTLIQAVMMALGRTGRFPEVADLGGQPYRVSMLMDTNMPDDMHWYYKLAEIKKPVGWEFFRQPPAMFGDEGPDGKMIYVPNRGQKIAQGIMPAENIENLGEGWNYYQKLLSANTDDWIKVFIMAEYGTITTGKPVYPGYSDLRHYANKSLEFDKSKTLFLMFDYGLDVCCIIGQMGWGGQVRLLEEVIPEESMAIERFWDTLLRDKLVNDYAYGRGASVFAVGDPAGEQRSQVNEDSPIRFLQRKGLNIMSCLVYKPKDRIPCVDHFLRKTANKGEPAFLLSNKCPKLRKGFSGWYFYKQLSQHVDEVYSGDPCKNSFSHPQDALQYGCHVMKNLDLYDTDFRAAANLHGGASAGTVESQASYMDINSAGI